MKISGASILITGASRGLGRVLAVECARAGGRVSIAARDENALHETSALMDGGARGLYAFDLVDRSAVERAAAQIVAEGRAPDILVHNAADVTSKPLRETSPEEIEHLISANITGPLVLTRALLPAMLERGRGSVVWVSSLAGYKPNPTQTVYSITKTAVNGAAAALRAELKGTGVDVMNAALSSVGPGGYAPERYARRLIAAIERGETELFLSPVTKYLMRLYAFCPALARLR